MLRLGILGCGRIGQVHAQSIGQVPNAELVAVADAMPAAADALASASGAEARAAEDILGAGDIDAVVIGTPTDTHFDLIQAAAANRKAVFCEKPIDMDVARIRACIDAVEAAGVAFMSGFNRRFDPNFAGLQRRLREGEIGEVEIVTILSRDPSPPPISYIESSGGLFRDMMIHDFDMARFLLGEEPVRVQAVGAALVDPAIGAAGDVDTAAAILTTASGRICQISNSRRATYGYDQRIEVHGAKGLLKAENQLESTVELATEAGFRRAPTQHFFLERYAQAYVLELAEFVGAVLDGKAPAPSIHDGLRAQALADAADLALREARLVEVDLT
ncbi:inositol 2-dehydrogenase [Roseobacter sp. HKCCD9010]|uniref:inositol 2-dehydrogenase n=1 Tax=unclassified Roseobacter TaxID=196798 RepID=UPI001491A1D4|nr:MULTISPECIES: inositol 2-dehydrogenase [unclassified Roseobacter]MBF9051807.1 inositol 2-dehydrogenase [Rhodobacterales bacterium HKCCD4356]NNV13800.1 inositol 2-dehydrogenase [Roseobacter sp. HKCCD7357]NNV17825.1 inositol 2-dehydrogenase [Roseobacter sp. HKCCD8768]NNV27432.1 inositol 2-dehydrogenase [Roseobacter sp. HKCCD8192]NNV31552.1 inositol 2-dehydrogenase [Roseobacter sp. HKCCD9061]